MNKHVESITEALFDVKFASQHPVWVAGTDGENAIILKSDDSGKTWKVDFEIEPLYSAYCTFRSLIVDPVFGCISAGYAGQVAIRGVAQ